MRSISSLRRVPSSGRRLLATASLAGFAIVGATFSASPSVTASKTVLSNSLTSVNAAAMIPLRRPDVLDAPATASPLEATAQASDTPTPASPPIATKPIPAAPAPKAPVVVAPPPKPPVDSPVVTLAANDTSVPTGSTVSFTATAKHHNGTGLAAATLQLQRSSKGAWTTIASAKLTAKGVAKMSVKPTSAAKYRVYLSPSVISGTTIAKAAASATVAVRTELPIGRRIVNYAAKFKGHRYVFGAAGPKYFDCSGLVLYVFKHVVGITLPHQAAQQFHYGKKVSRKNAKPGDLVFVWEGSRIGHVAIYTGHGMWWEAPHTGASVRHVKIWSKRIEFRRLTK